MIGIVLHIRYKRLHEISLKFQNLSDVGGGLLLEKHNNSPSALLKVVYPEYEWLPWRFNRCPPEYWSDMGNQQKFMEWAGKELKIKEMNDWYKVSVSVFCKEKFR